MPQHNGVLDTSYLHKLIPRGTVADGTTLLVKPATDLIGAGGAQWSTRGASEALFAASVLFKRRTGKAVYVLEAWRSLTTQRVYYDLYRMGKGNLAAMPGTSNHGWGVSFDLASGIDLGGEDYRIFTECAAVYGLRNDVASEKWHWTFYVAEQKRRPDELVGLTPAGGDAVIINEEEFTVSQYEDLMTALAAQEKRITDLTNVVVGDRNVIARIDANAAAANDAVGNLTNVVVGDRPVLARIDANAAAANDAGGKTLAIVANVQKVVDRLNDAGMAALARIDIAAAKIVNKLGA